MRKPNASPLIHRILSSIEGSKGGEEQIDALQKRVTGILDRPVPLDLLSGRTFGHPAHPAAVQVPLGLWMGALLVDRSGAPGAPRVARLLVGVGTAAVLPALATGLVEWMHTRDAERRVGAVHAAANVLATGLFASSWLRRRSGRSGQLTALAGATVASVGGWLGGHLAYGRGVGVNTSAFVPVPREWTAIASTADAVRGRATGARVGGLNIVATRLDDGAVAALDARCSHRGGPLQDGPVHGDCVTCPWHGSVFSMVNGSVLQGPASVPQLTLDCQEHDGHVEVRSADPGGLRSVGR